MKNYFTKEQLNQLKSFEQHFYTAVYENYKRASAASDNDKIADLYEKTTGNKLNRNWSCGTCVLNCYKAVGALYYESKKHLEENETVQAVGRTTNQVQNTPTTEIPSDTQKVQEETEVNNPEVVVLEPEPAPVKATSNKKVAKSDTDQEQNTQETSVPDDTQKVQKRNKATQTKSKGFDKKKIKK